MLKPLKFHNQILKYILMPQYLEKLKVHGNLDEALLKVHMASHDVVLADIEPEMFKSDVSLELRQKTLQVMRQKAEEESRNNIAQYLPIIVNLILVSFCTVLDAFLTDSLTEITKEKPGVLKGLANDRTMNIGSILETGNWDELVDTIRVKVISRFDHMGIEEKLEILTKKLGVPTAEAIQLKLHNDEVQQRFSLKPRFLAEIYEKRNMIVHQDVHSITSVEELSEISEYIVDFILDLGIIMGKHFGIETDFQLFFE